MCVYSMIIDHYRDKWAPYIPSPYKVVPDPWPTAPPSVVPMPYPVPALPSPITPAEVEEFRKLLDRARRYDRDHNEPDCELEQKKKAIQDLADKLGVDIRDLFDEPQPAPRQSRPYIPGNFQP